MFVLLRISFIIYFSIVVGLIFKCLPKIVVCIQIHYEGGFSFIAYRKLEIFGHKLQFQVGM